MSALEIEVGIVTISDRVVAGECQDEAGQALERALAGRGRKLKAKRLVSDDAAQIETAILELADHEDCALVLTTGGTGLAPREVTPEAVHAIAVKELPGFGEMMRAESAKISRHAMLSRGMAAVVGRALVVCLPGTPKGAVECLSFVAGIIPHAVGMISEQPAAHG